MFIVRLALVLLSILFLPVVYADRRLSAVVGCRFGGWRVAMWLVAALLAIGLVCFLLMWREGCVPLGLRRVFLCVYLGASGAGIFFCIGDVLHRCFRKFGLVARLLHGLCISLAVANIILVVMAYFIGNKRIDVAEYIYYSKDLPASFDGLRIVAVSDLHLGTYGSDSTRVAQLIDKTIEQKGDMIVFVGDLVNFESKEIVPFVDELSRLKAPLGVFSVLGNHDYGVYRNFKSKREQVADIARLVELERLCGWHVLRNQNVVLERGGDKIALIGVENDGKPPFPQLADIPKAMRGLPLDDGGKPLFKVMLTHDPCHWRRKVLSDTDVQLTLSGHTHGMQFKVFGLSPAALIYKEWGGQYFEGERSLIVSLGLGLGAVPFRFGAWSEVCVITLRKK